MNVFKISEIQMFYYIKGTEPTYNNTSLDNLIPTVKMENIEEISSSMAEKTKADIDVFCNNPGCYGKE